MSESLTRLAAITLKTWRLTCRRHRPAARHYVTPLPRASRLAPKHRIGAPLGAALPCPGPRRVH